jgi:formylglycine-generating enzyme required for sulfatase activity
MQRKKTYVVSAVLLLAVIGFSIRPIYRQYLVGLDYAAPLGSMVLVPAGNFYLGTDNIDAGEDEQPLREEFLRAFYIDKFEVTNAEFKAFDPTHVYADDQGDFPATGVRYQRANAYAESVGKRLPTRAEWEKAARGTDGRDYTWGNEFRVDIANIGGKESLKPVGSHPQSVSPFGVHDMIGNAWEWVSDIHRDGGLFVGSPIERGILKGGAYSYSAFQGRASFNGFESLNTTCNDVGFRCVQDAQRSSS